MPNESAIFVIFSALVVLGFTLVLKKFLRPALAGTPFEQTWFMVLLFAVLRWRA